jgi:hypothetical protein
MKEELITDNRAVGFLGPRRVSDEIVQAAAGHGIAYTSRW